MAYSSKYGHISPEVVGQVFSEGLHKAEEAQSKDTIVYGNGRGVVGLGAYIGYTGAKYRAFDNLDAGWNFNNLILGVRGALHYQFVNRLDTYLGLFLGYNITMTNDYGSFPSGLRPSAPAVGGFEFAFYVGARYYLTQRFAVFGEVGYGLATVNLGLAYKF